MFPSPTLALTRRLWPAVAVLAVLFLAWLAARRAGKRANQAVIMLVALAVLCFLAAVFAPRPPMTSGVAVALVLFSAVLLVVALAAVFFLGISARRRRIDLVEHKGPPWEEGW